MGNRRFDTEDDSRNSFILSLITLGEGWHNNHHRYMSATRQGFYWWEIDITYYVLKALSFTGFIWDLKAVPASIYREADERNRRESTAGFSLASVQDEFHSLKKMVPTAAALAIATVNPPTTLPADAHPTASSASQPQV